MTASILDIQNIRMLGVFISNCMIFVDAIYSNKYVRLTKKECNPNLPGYLMFFIIQKNVNIFWQELFLDWSAQQK